MFIFDGESNKFNSLVAMGSKATSLMFPDDQGRNNHEKHQNITNPLENHANHENPRIPFENP